jgi:hypothetical protein
MTQPLLSVGALTVPLDVGPPLTLYWPIVPATMPAGVPPLDMTTVIGVTFRVRQIQGSWSNVWMGSIYSPLTTTTFLVVTYPFTGEDFPAVGQYRIEYLLQVPGGIVPPQAPGVVQVTAPVG